MASVEQSIEIDLPVETVYSRWAQFAKDSGGLFGVDNSRLSPNSHVVAFRRVTPTKTKVTLQLYYGPDLTTEVQGTHDIVSRRFGDALSRFGAFAKGRTARRMTA